MGFPAFHPSDRQSQRRDDDELGRPLGDESKAPLGDKSKAPTVVPSISKLNAMTTNNKAAFDNLDMPPSVRKQLLSLDFEDWADVEASTKCGTAMAEEIQKLVASYDFDARKLKSEDGATSRGVSHGCVSAKPVTAISCLLAPGEVLYVPPYWFHRVKATEFSVSLNKWTTSAEQYLHLALERQPLPHIIESKTTAPKDKVAALATYIRGLGADLATPGDRFGFIRRIAMMRYMPSAAAWQCGDSKWTTKKCPSTPPSEEAASVWTKAANIIKRMKRSQASLLQHAGRTHRPVHEMLLADHIDTVVVNVLGQMRTCKFLRCAGDAAAWPLPVHTDDDDGADSDD